MTPNSITLMDKFLCVNLRKLFFILKQKKKLKTNNNIFHIFCNFIIPFILFIISFTFLCLKWHKIYLLNVFSYSSAAIIFMWFFNTPLHISYIINTIKSPQLFNRLEIHSRIKTKNIRIFSVIYIKTYKLNSKNFQ